MIRHSRYLHRSAGSAALLLLVCGLLSVLAGAVQAEPLPPREADSPDLIVVFKSERRLYLYQQGWPIRSYPIQLGLVPSGPKRYEGDKRTPEGSYMIDWRNPDSRFYKSLHITYPNEADQRAAQAVGRSAGGLIMIHGQPVYSDRPRKGDWTDGCIAVSNEAMDELWELVKADTRIHIYP